MTTDMKIPSSNLGRTCCVKKLFLTFKTIFVHNMFSPCSAKGRSSDKDLPVSKLYHVRSWLTYRNYNSVWWTLSCIVMNVAKSLNAKSRCYFRKTFPQFRKDYYKKWIWKDFHKNLTMGGLTLPHNRVSYQRRRTSVFWWIPWHLHWCHPSKASQIRIRLPKNKKNEAFRINYSMAH